MKILYDDRRELYGQNVMLVKTLMKRQSPEEHPDLMKWKLQMLYFNGDWIEICRIDNYPHGQQKGSHIHYYKKDEVKRVELTFQEADKLIKEISARMLIDEFKEEIKFGDD